MGVGVGVGVGVAVGFAVGFGMAVGVGVGVGGAALPPLHAAMRMTVNVPRIATTDWSRKGIIPIMLS